MIYFKSEVYTTNIINAMLRVKYNSAKKELKSYWLSREKRVYYYWYKRYVFSDLAEKLLDANNRRILEILRV